MSRRLAPEARRAQLLDAAGRLLTERGADAVQVTELAQAAGVTRPVVYRFFDNRQAILLALVEDFADTVDRHFAQQTVEGDLEAVARGFVEVVCAAIDARGAGVWHLLDARGPDPRVAEAGAAAMDRIVDPWRAGVAAMVGDTRTGEMVLRMLLAAGRAAIGSWLDGALSREAALSGAARGISALLRAYAEPPVDDRSEALGPPG
jgi:AcrR family transcriptional regulator